MDKITAPILLVAFNRPHCIRKVMQQMEKIKPTKLYFSIDAARDGRQGEVVLVEKVKTIVKNITWECDCHYRFHEKNVGAEVNVSTAVKWVLEENEFVIVNEDDIYADCSFYKFAQDMLLHYKDDERIGLVSGLNLSPVSKNQKDVYYISRSGHIWGWGTWKRVWDKYSLNEEIKESNLSISKLEEYYHSKEMALNTRRILLNQAEKGVGKVTWDYMFWYHRIQQNYYAIVPNKNLVTNIGVEGLHASGLALTHFTERSSDFSIESYKEFEWSVEYDHYNFKNGSNRTLLKKVFNRIKLMYLKTFKYNNRYLDTFYKS